MEKIPNPARDAAKAAAREARLADQLHRPEASNPNFRNYVEKKRAGMLGKEDLPNEPTKH